MNSLIDEVSQIGKFGAPPNGEVHWTFDWFQPVKPNANSTNSNDPSTANGNNLVLGANDNNSSRTNLNRSGSNLFQLHKDNVNSNSNANINGTVMTNEHTETDGKVDEDDDAVERYSFKLKTWLKANQNDFANLESPENNTLTALDLNLFDRTRISANTDQTKIALEKNKRVDENGLTEKDIRGAVGGSESIPGLSSSNKKEEPTTVNNEEKLATSTVTEQPKEEKNVATNEVEPNQPTDEIAPINTSAPEQPIIEEHSVVQEETPVIEPSVEISVETSVETSVEPSTEQLTELSIVPDTVPSIEPSMEPSTGPSLQNSNEIPTELTSQSPRESIETPQNESVSNTATPTVDNEGDIRMEE